MILSRDEILEPAGNGQRKLDRERESLKQKNVKVKVKLMESAKCNNFCFYCSAAISVIEIQLEQFEKWRTEPKTRARERGKN